VVAGWERKALRVITLTVIVGVLGIVTDARLPLNRSWCKAATVVAGGVVSLVTVLTTSVFAADHRTFASKARQVKGLIDDVHLILAQGPPEHEEDRQVWIDEMRDPLKQRLRDMRARQNDGLVGAASGAGQREISREP
jgi:hypothetical protein